MRITYKNQPYMILTPEEAKTECEFGMQFVDDQRTQMVMDEMEHTINILWEILEDVEINGISGFERGE